MTFKNMKVIVLVCFLFIYSNYALAPCSYDESKNTKGENRCNKDEECQGKRTCSVFGWCQGVSECLDFLCNIDEAKNALGKSKKRN